MEADPTKYWKVDGSDIRITLLRRFLESVDQSALQTDSTAEIVKCCVRGLANFKILSDEEIKLKNAILAQNAYILAKCANYVREELVRLRNKEFLCISLGCGDESVFERTLAENTAKYSPNIQLEWLGVDTADYRSPSSFLRDKPFMAVCSVAGTPYTRHKRSSLGMLVTRRRLLWQDTNVSP